MISHDTVSSAVDETSGFSAKQTAAAVYALSEAQPELFAFVMELTEGLSDKATKLALLLLLVVVRTFELGSPQRLKPVGPRALTRAYRANEAMLLNLLGASGLAWKTATDQITLRQPHLMRVLVQTVMDDSEWLSPIESGTLFVAMKTVVDALDADSRRARSTPRLKVVKKPA